MTESRGRAAARRLEAEHERTEARLDKRLSLMGKPRPKSEIDHQGCDGAAVRRAIEGWTYLVCRAVAELPPDATDDLVRERIISLIEEGVLEGVAIGVALGSPQRAAKWRDQAVRTRAVLEALPVAEDECRTKYGKLNRKKINSAVAKRVGCSARFVEQVTSRRTRWERAIGRRSGGKEAFNVRSSG